MKLWLRKSVLLLAFAGLPLQGVAATLSNLLCPGDANAPAMHIDESDVHGAHNDGPRDGQQNNEGSTTNAVPHLCGHVTVVACSSMALMFALPDSPVQVFLPDPLHDLFCPDQPQRPPLA